MMGAGKTTVGHALSALTGWPCLDNDELVRRATGHPTPDVLRSDGEPTLRRVELDALAVALDAVPPVIAGVAAGVVTDPDARRRMRDGGFVVYLRVPLEELARRVSTGGGRPWLTDDPIRALRRLAIGRDPLYREVADLVLEAGEQSPVELARRIMDAVQRR